MLCSCRYAKKAKKAEAAGKTGADADMRALMYALVCPI